MIGMINNLGVMIGLSAMARHSKEVNTSLERLATGKKINRASDDPAGMVASESMETRLRVLSKKIDGLIFEDKRTGAIEGAQSALFDLVEELNGLVVGSANGAGITAKEREANQVQVNSVLEAIDHIAGTTTFNGEKILEYLDSRHLGLEKLREGGEQNVVSGDLERAQQTVQGAIDSLQVQQEGLAIHAKDINSQINMARTEFENLSAAKSQIVDTDYAEEMSKYVRASVLRDAAAFMAGMAMKENAHLIQVLLG